MMETTSALFHRLRKRESGESVLQEAWAAPTCARMLREEIERVGISAPEWIASADISKSYGYQVLRGERMPGRDILLRTALVLQLSLQETQRLLALGDCGALYPKVRRDAAVIFALNHKMTLLPEASLFGQEKQT